jgi:hypothetical protein
MSIPEARVYAVDFEPWSHSPKRRVRPSFEPCRLGGSNGGGVEPSSTAARPPPRCVPRTLSSAKMAGGTCRRTVRPNVIVVVFREPARLHVHPLTDDGLRPSLEEVSGLSSFGAILATFAYMAPANCRTRSALLSTAQTDGFRKLVAQPKVYRSGRDYPFAMDRSRSRRVGTSRVRSLRFEFPCSHQ